MTFLKEILILLFADWLDRLIKQEISQEFANTLLHKLKGPVYTLTVRKMKAMVRRVCREEGLSTGETRVIMAVVSCESGFWPWATHKNKDGTIDWGIAMYNDYWYRKVISPDEALKNPEKAVSIMIKRYKEGGLKDWICYRDGYWKSHLDKV